MTTNPSDAITDVFIDAYTSKWGIAILIAMGAIWVILLLVQNIHDKHQEADKGAKQPDNIAKTTAQHTGEPKQPSKVNTSRSASTTPSTVNKTAGRSTARPVVKRYKDGSKNVYHPLPGLDTSNLSQDEQDMFTYLMGDIEMIPRKRK